MLRAKLPRIAAFIAAIVVGLTGASLAAPPLAAPAQAMVALTPGPDITLVNRDAHGVTIGLAPPAAWLNAGGAWPVYRIVVGFGTTPDHTDADKIWWEDRFDTADPPNPYWPFTVTLDQPTQYQDALDPGQTWYAHAIAYFLDGSASEWSSLPGYAWGTAPGTEPPPDPEPADPLALKSVDIDRATPSPQLKWPVKFTPVDAAAPIVQYEYAWATVPDGTRPRGSQKCIVGQAKCWLDVSNADNGTRWNLLVRAIARDGSLGPWFTHSVELPKSIVVAGIGDSIISGHHRDGEGLPTICHDDQYSLVSTVYKKLKAKAPAKWRDAYVYVNVAQSGFGLTEIIGGGRDACDDFQLSPLTLVQTLLKDNAGSWNVVVADGGINETNWGGVLTSILTNFGKIKKASDCQQYVDRWSLIGNTGLQSSMTANAGHIAETIMRADPSARLMWTGYYNVAGTGVGIGPVKFEVPKVCKGPLDKGRKLIEGLIKPAVTSQSATWVPLDPVIGGRDDLLQDIYPSDRFFGRSGWPHLNGRGSEVGGATVTKKL